MNWKLKKWGLCVVHNCIVHPLMPLAEALEHTKADRVAQAIFALHDKTWYGEE